MVSPEVILAALAVALALLFDFTNGFHDSANQVATVIKTNSMRPMVALSIAAVFDFIGAFFLGTAVAQTLGKGIVDPTLLAGGVPALLVVISALCGAIIWNLYTWKFGIPSSSSHALIGGLIGAFVAGWGFAPVNWHKVAWIFGALLASPVIGFAVSWFITKSIFWVSKVFSFSIRMNVFFKKAQYLTLIAQSLAHGTNDAQKTMGVICFVMVISGFYPPVAGKMVIPTWIITTCSISLALGIFSGGWRIIKKMNSIYPFRPVHSYASQLSSAGIIYSASFLGLPISTTQVISSSNMGSGSAEHAKLVHWKFAEQMVETWMATIPASATIAAMFLFIFRGQWLYVLGMAMLVVAGYTTMQKVKKIFKKLNLNGSKDFQQMLIEQASSVLDGLKLAKEYCAKPSIELADIVDDAEKKADEVHRALINCLKHSFVTGPFDRHNIENLSQRLDDILDEAKKAVYRMEIIGVEPDKYIGEMFDELDKSVVFLKSAIENLTVDSKECQISIDSARKRENAIQHIFERWYTETRPRAEEFQDANAKTLKDALVRMVKCRDEEKVQIALMKSADWVVAAANEIETILAKMS